MNSVTPRNNITRIAAFISIIFTAVPANAQGLNNSAWSPQQTSRASIAALIRQEEKGEKSGLAAFGTGNSNVTQLICGSNSGEGKSTSANAQANSSCIIMNNSNGVVEIDQASDGDQTATAKNNVKANGQQVNDESLTEALQGLTGSGG
jgi:hypothetical protein